MCYLYNIYNYCIRDSIIYVWIKIKFCFLVKCKKYVIPEYLEYFMNIK